MSRKKFSLGAKLWLVAISMVAISSSDSCGQSVSRASFQQQQYEAGKPVHVQQRNQLSNVARADLQPAVDVEYGQQRPVIDGIGNILAIPRKLALWNRRIDNHQVTQTTVMAVNNYLADQSLYDVKIRVNQYAPLGEWRRLVQNKRISPLIKYTFGTANHLRYTLLPGRLFGGDEYNPYTNSISLYSDVPAMGMVEAAYARDIEGRRYPGLYAISQELPAISIWHETLATSEVVSYVTIQGTPDEIDENRKILYARYGLILGGEVGNAVGGGPIFPIIGASAGHVAAAVKRHKNVPIKSSNR